MSDDASFNPRHVNAIYGDTLRCIVTDMASNVECHHILGRGGKHDRKIMSSILNCAPLWNTVHAKGWINNDHFRMFLLWTVKAKVLLAIQRGMYEYTKTDLEFLKFTETLDSPRLL